MSKKLYTVLHPVAIGGRRERGEEILLDEETAASIGPNYLEEAPAPSAGDSSDEESSGRNDQAGESEGADASPEGAEESAPPESTGNPVQDEQGDPDADASPEGDDTARNE